MQFQVLLHFPLPWGQLWASFLPCLGIILNAFSLNNSKPLFKKVGTVAVQNWSISKDICDCLLVSTRNLFVQPLLTTVHTFLYIYICFRTFRIAIRPNKNNYYNKTNVSTTFCVSQMKWIFWPTLLPSLFTNTTNCTISLWMQVSYLFGTSARICRDNL